MKIYVVMGENDEYPEDRESWIVSAYREQSEADHFSKKFAEKAAEYMKEHEFSYDQKYLDAAKFWIGDKNLVITNGTKKLRYWIEEVDFFC